MSASNANIEEEMPSDEAASSSDSDTDNELERKIEECLGALKQNPYHYETHTTLVNLLEKSGEFEKLHDARQSMSKLFPLTPELWLAWVRHEIKFCDSDEQKEREILPLFERAVADYSSISLWLEYATFCIGLMNRPDGVKRVRDVFEKAVSRIGLDASDGAIIWETYREFEATILTTMQKDAEDEALRDVYNEQKQRVYNLFKRQLSVPLFNMDATMQELKAFSESVEPSVERAFAEAKRKLEEIEPFESKLPNYEAYIEYLNYELSKKDPSRIQCLFERAVLEHPLVPELWQKYTDYMDFELGVNLAALPVHQRSIRNCPWAATLWVGLLECQERCSLSHEDITATMEEALQAGLTGPKDLESVWLCYVAYQRRRLCSTAGSVSEENANILRSCFERAKSHLAEFNDFKNGVDVTTELLQHYAILEAKFLRDTSRAREIWNQITRQGSVTSSAIWMQFAAFERAFGDDKHYRKVLQRGMYASIDWPEYLGDEWIRFEQREGSREEVDYAREKYLTHMRRVNEKRDRAAARDTAKQEEMEAQKRTQRDAKKRRAFDANGDSQSNQSEARGKKRPVERTDPFGNPKKPKTTDDSFVKPAAPMSSTQPKMEVDSTPEAHGVLTGRDLLKEQQTVFLSNLAFEVTDQQILDVFKDVGEVEELRLVRDYKGRSKGFGYLVFKNISSVSAALKLDRTPIDGRPMFISKCNERKQFSYTVGLEKNKLFVRNVPFTVTQEKLEELFKQHGKCEVRLCTYRNGKSKGMAYVDYADESAASIALVKLDGYELDGKMISVSISNPPARSRPHPSSSGESRGQQQQQQRITSLGSGSRDKSQTHARTRIAFVPRSVQLQKTAAEARRTTAAASSSTETTTPVQPMKNEDFRSMLLKK